MEIGRGCSEYQWDWALGAGRRIAGVAVDDCHGFDDVGKGWVTVKSEELSAEGLINALSKGMFYSSCGPEIRALRVSPAGIEVETSPCRSIAFVADRQAGKYCVADPDASGLALAAYRFRGKETYVRVEIVDAQGRKAWSNPIYPEPAKAEEKT
jgi:hypothetical protein